MTVNPKNGKLTVQLYENALSGKKDEYTGRILLRGSITLEELADIVHKDDTSLTREQLVSACQNMSNAALIRLADGFSVKLGSCIARAVINGVFAGEAAKFNPDLHHISISFSPTREARQIIKTAIVEVVGTAHTGVVINRVLDVRTSEENGTLTPRYNLKIFGSRLTIEGTAPEVGVWFVSAIDEATKIQVEQPDIVDNTPSLVTVLVPQLESGDWYVQVSTQSTSNKGVLLKEARTYRLDIPLSVL